MEKKQIIQKSLLNSISYTTYRNLIDKMVEEGRTSGPEQTQDLIDYTALNEKRYKRLDKTIKISEEKAEFFKNYSKSVTFLVITETWCGDAAQIVPVINKIAELNPKITLKLVFRDENEELMNLFLTNGGKAIPIVVILDLKDNVLASWGSRPSVATKMVEDYKAQHGKLSAEFKEELQKWYNQDKGNNIVDDFIKILSEK
ncbi:thioredoxin family protein [Capnocytophaga felis]|uniref:Thioredoxin n=1 Tax=Capnocytophaga felis TaxID=2267611 RepID=A0A5M4B915_9FLAO|nr:thioredoxin family protein [Capnocytophaga felis]GET45755.1 thioredoxin [Capnocytophaga felis]GET48024.1 thioredoxin [Capnocytophaga felis]